MEIRQENRDYDVYPKIVKADTQAEITIRPIFQHAQFNSKTSYEIMLVPMVVSAQVQWQEICVGREWIIWH